MNFNSNSKGILINTIEGINVIQVRDGERTASISSV